MNDEYWTNGEKTFRLRPASSSYFYFKIKDNDPTLWISGITLYWLINNNFKRISK